MNLNIWSGLSPYFPWWRSVKAPSWINISSPGVELPYSRVVLVLVLLELLTRDIQKWRTRTCQYQEYSCQRRVHWKKRIVCIRKSLLKMEIFSKKKQFEKFMLRKVVKCSFFISSLIFVFVLLKLVVDIAVPDWMSLFWKLHDFFSFFLLCWSLSNLVFWGKRKSPVEF